MIFVIYGTERFLMDRKLAQLKKEYNCNNENMNYSSYDLSKESMDDVYQDLITPPFLTDNKLVVLTNVDFLTTKKVKKDNNDDEVFLKCLKEMDESVHLVVFNDEKNFDERKKVVKALRAQATVFTIDPLNHYKVSDTTRQAIKRREATISDEALNLLLLRCNDNLIDITNEVEKLCLYTKDITLDTVELMVNKPLDENVFDLTSAIMNKDVKKIFSVYQDLMVLKEEPVKLIVLIANSMRLIYQVKLLDRKGYTDKEIAKILGVKPTRLIYIRKEGKEFDLNELLGYLDQLSQLDVKIKTGQIDKQKGLELFLMKIY